MMLGVLNMKWSIMLHFYRSVLLRLCTQSREFCHSQMWVSQEDLFWKKRVILYLHHFNPGCNVADEYLSILECLLIFCNYWAWSNVHVHSYTLSYDLLTTFFFLCVMMFHGVFFYQLIYLLYILCGLPILLSKATGSRSLRGWEEITRGFVCFFVRGRPLRPSSVMISYTLSVSPVAVESIIEV